MIARVKSIFQNESFMRYFRNSSWMIMEYGLRVVSAIFVSIYVARYLGPEQFGILSYALAVVIVFMTISRLGMDSILVRDLSKDPTEAKAYMGTSFWLMVIASIVFLVVLSTLVYFVESDPNTKGYIWIISLGLLFQALLVVDFGFQAQVKARYSSIAKSSALIVGSMIKLYLVWAQADLEFFAIAYVIDSVVIGIMLLVMHFYQRQINFLFSFNIEIARRLLKSSWPMVLSAVAAMLYLRIDQIMIQNMIGSYELGLYMASSKLLEMWIMLVYVISISLLPVLAKKRSGCMKQYEVLVINIFRGFVFSGFLFMVFILIFGDEVIELTFGVEYKNALVALLILSLGAPLIALRVITVRYLTIEGLEKKVATRTIIALIISIALNYLLIPIFGISGAAMSTVLALFYSAYLANFFDSDLHQLRRINMNVFLKLKVKL